MKGHRQPAEDPRARRAEPGAAARRRRRSSGAWPTRCSRACRGCSWPRTLSAASRARPTKTTRPAWRSWPRTASRTRTCRSTTRGPARRPRAGRRWASPTGFFIGLGFSQGFLPGFAKLGTLNTCLRRPARPPARARARARSCPTAWPRRAAARCRRWWRASATRTRTWWARASAWWSSSAPPTGTTWSATPSATRRRAPPVAARRPRSGGGKLCLRTWEMTDGLRSGCDDEACNCPLGPWAGAEGEL